MIRTLIHVTEEDIAQGIRHNPMSCPVAHALRRELHHDCSVTRQGYVMNNRPPLIFYNSWFYKRYVVDSVLRFVRRFDAGKPVKPFNFYHVER